jgi:uncharacterized protein with PQ loop repeat
MRIFGWIGGGLSVLYNIPQIYHIYTQKSTNDISIISLLVRLISYSWYFNTRSTIVMDDIIFFTTSFNIVLSILLI